MCQWPISARPAVPVVLARTTAKIGNPVQQTARHVQSETFSCHNQTVLERLPRTLQYHDTPPVFSMQDMRLFNHFVKTAYPSHPHGNDSIWTHEVPNLACRVSCNMSVANAYPYTHTTAA